MEQHDNLKSVMRMYASFGEGDIPAILKELEEDVEWWLAGPTGPQGIPYAGTYRGHNGVMQFFQDLGQAVQIEVFQPREFVTEGDRVVVIGQEQGRAKPTGRPFENQWVHVFTFQGGKVCQFREFGDTAALVEAFRPK